MRTSVFSQVNTFLTFLSVYVVRMRLKKNGKKTTHSIEALKAIGGATAQELHTISKDLIFFTYV